MTMLAIVQRTAILCFALAIATSWGFAGTSKKQKRFDTPEQASEALIAAAGAFDIPALTEILGPDGMDLVVTDDPVLDKNQAAAFADKASLLLAGSDRGPPRL